mmetsp:Transcript_36272/g.59158  ORF Transcript_36272/g.59158 Transcript_36272/m.59158 type:complete len:106 (+) Transcript_36272:607-924(+)
MNAGGHFSQQCLMSTRGVTRRSQVIFDRELQKSTTGKSLEFLDWVVMATRVWCWVDYSVDTANSARNALMIAAAQTHQQLKNAKEVASSAAVGAASMHSSASMHS